MSSAPISILDSILTRPAGTVRLVVGRDIPGALADLRTWLGDGLREARLVTETFDALPSPDKLLAEAIENLAEVALAVWPDWPRGPTKKLDAGIGPSVEGRFASVAWAKAARELCRAGKLPLPAGFARPTHAAELALAIGPRSLILALCVNEPNPARGRLLGLSRAAEWLARETSARVLVLAPDWLLTSSELDGINFDPVRWPTPLDSASGRSSDNWAPRIWPIIGRPHPDSPGEQALARQLALDPELSGLFAFNVHVRVRRDVRYLVDLLWAEGKVVVEVDGYQYHHDRGSFSRDRLRDYELLISGHLVLRLPHDEVVEDVQSAVEKIRNVVRFRRAEVSQPG